MPKRQPKINPASPFTCPHCERVLTSKFAVKHHTCQVQGPRRARGASIKQEGN